MMTLIQLINLFGAESIESWCNLIAQDEAEMYDFIDILEDNGVELSERQIDSLLRVCLNGSYKSAMALNK